MTLPPEFEGRAIRKHDTWSIQRRSIRLFLNLLETPDLKRNSKMLEQLTDRQRKVYMFIRDLIHSRGYGPTVREIGDEFEIASPNGVMCHLRALERKGLIRRSKREARAIELLHEPASADDGLPLAGRVAAGVMHEAVEQNKTIDFKSMFERPGCFVLEITGDSMIEAQIADGDFAVVDPNRRAVPGDIVVARTSEGEATLKYWFPEEDRVRLQPANSTMKPIYARDVQAIGVVIGVVRRMS